MGGRGQTEKRVDLCEFEVSLDYTVSSTTGVRGTKRDPDLKSKQTNKNLGSGGTCL